MTYDHDFIIIGAGMAGLQLANAFLDDSHFKSKSILIIEPHQKNPTEKTWCFWEKGPGIWDNIIYKKWNQTQFIGNKKNTILDLDNYSYKMLRSNDFEDFVISKINNSRSVNIKYDSVINIDKHIVNTKNDSISAGHIFDSRIENTFYLNSKKVLIQQHFKGYFIKTNAPVFNNKVFTIMDYSIKYKDDTSFTYVLPFTENLALVEFTFFTPHVVEDQTYDKYLERYIKTVLKINDYTILNKEKGNIPMTSYPFYNSNSNSLTKIGTAGGWIKSSSGYGFKNTEKKIRIILKNIKNSKPINSNLFSRKFQLYDKIFLNVLYYDNMLGEKIFSKFYRKNDIKLTFKFLDEETSILEDFKIIWSLTSFAFIKALFR